MANITIEKTIPKMSSRGSKYLSIKDDQGNWYNCFDAPTFSAMEGMGGKVFDVEIKTEQKGDKTFRNITGFSGEPTKVQEFENSLTESVYKEKTDDKERKIMRGNAINAATRSKDWGLGEDVDMFERANKIFNWIQE
jgi:hypothetical protein